MKLKELSVWIKAFGGQLSDGIKEIRNTDKEKKVLLWFSILGFFGACLLKNLPAFPTWSVNIIHVEFAVSFLLALGSIYQFDQFRFWVIYGILYPSYLRGKCIPIRLENFVKDFISNVQKYCILACRSILFSGLFFLIVNEAVVSSDASFSQYLSNIRDELVNRGYIYTYVLLGAGCLSLSYQTWKAIAISLVRYLWSIGFVLLFVYFVFLFFMLNGNSYLGVIETQFGINTQASTFFAYWIIAFLLKWVVGIGFRSLKGDEWLEYYKNDIVLIFRGESGTGIQLSKYVNSILFLEKSSAVVPYFFDSPITTSDKDQLDIKSKVSEIFDLIYKYELPKNTQAVSIGIEGAWGSGKTSLVNILKHDYLDKVQGSVVYFEFNVWQHSGKLSESFFSEFKNFLVKKEIIDSKLEAKFDVYIEKLSGLHTAFNILHLANSIFVTHDTVKDIYDDILEAIKKSNKRIVIIIDDIDRLGSWDQWNEIFSIQRASANFPNVFFVMCFSQEQLCRIWKEKYEKDSASDIEIKKNVGLYIEKIFNFIYELDYSALAMARTDSHEIISNYYIKLSNISIDKIVQEYMKDEVFAQSLVAKFEALTEKVQKSDSKVNKDILTHLGDIHEADTQKLMVTIYIHNCTSVFLNSMFSLKAKHLMSAMENIDFIPSDTEGYSRTPRFVITILNKLLTYGFGVSRVSDADKNKISLNTGAELKLKFLDGIDELSKSIEDGFLDLKDYLDSERKVLSVKSRDAEDELSTKMGI